jgi:hypothetical protein
MESLGLNVFNVCPKITEIVVPSGVASIDSIAASCKNLRSIVFLGNTQIVGNCAYSCSALEFVCLGTQIAELPTRVFSDCNRLRAIVIPESLTTAHTDAIARSRGAMLFFRSPANAEAITAVLNEGRTSSPLVAYLYSETPPTEAGNWWHFDENGVPVAYE